MDDKTALETLAKVARNATGWQKLEAAGIKPNGTMRKWFEAHEGKKVGLVQINVAEDGTASGLFVPGERTVRTRPSGVSMDGSHRDYAGCRVLHGGDNELIVVSNWGDDARQIMWFWDEHGFGLIGQS